MINYEGGLLRRGLSGEIILITSEIIKINSSYILIFLQTALFLFFLVSFLLIKKKKKIKYLVHIFTFITCNNSLYLSRSTCGWKKRSNFFLIL